MVVCGYGYAASSTDLMISGEAMVKKTPRFGITYMQQMTADVCTAAEVGTEQQLIDNRDGKKYWVAKTADNNCWMTQNLALDLKATGNYTSENTDLQSGSASAAGYTTYVAGNGTKYFKWDANSKYPPRDTVIGSPIETASNAGNYVAPKSCGGGDYIIVYPYRLSGITNEAVSSMNNVRGVTLKDVTGWQPADKSNPGYAYDEATRTYNAHYLIGNYYQVGAATAGSSTTSSTGNSPASSICPKGWRLPRYNTSGLDEWKKLLNKAGFTSSTSSGMMDAAGAPLYLLRAGLNGANGFTSVGNIGGYLTANSANNSQQVYFYISGDALKYAQRTYRSVGRSIRCVAR